MKLAPYPIDELFPALPRALYHAVSPIVLSNYLYLDQGGQGNGESWGAYPWIGTSNYDNYGTAPGCFASTAAGLPNALTGREGAHNSGANIAFCDGHVKWMPPGHQITQYIPGRNNATCGCGTITGCLQTANQYWYNPTSTLTTMPQ